MLGQSSGVWTPPEPEPEPPQPDPPPLIQGSVIGYRAWRIMEWQLYGTGVNREWVPGVNEATCNQGTGLFGGTYMGMGYPPNRHPAPALGCACGITALARFSTSDEHWRQVDVFGAIEAWGEEGKAIRPEPGDVADATGLDLQRTDQAQEHHDSGGFILHRNGFRARYGKVVLLAVDEDWPLAKTAAVRALAQEHGADVCKREHLEDAAKEHGQLVDEKLLEWVAKGEPIIGGGYLTQVSMSFLQPYAGFALRTITGRRLCEGQTVRGWSCAEWRGLKPADDGGLYCRHHKPDTADWLDKDDETDDE